MLEFPKVGGPTDIAFTEVLLRSAKKYNIKYILEVHSFIEEGISPVGKAYVDGGYISSVHKSYGKVKMRTFPNMTFFKFLYWTLFKRIKRIRPYWYIDYSKDNAKKILKEEFGWRDYSGHHLENRMSAFAHKVYAPQKFNLDQRNLVLSAKVRSGKITREQALEIFSKEIPIDQRLIDYVIKRFEITKEEYDHNMSLEPKFYFEFKNYKKRFIKMRPIFYLLVLQNLIPKSFYLKYCFPQNHHIVK